MVRETILHLFWLHFLNKRSFMGILTLCDESHWNVSTLVTSVVNILKLISRLAEVNKYSYQYSIVTKDQFSPLTKSSNNIFSNYVFSYIIWKFTNYILYKFDKIRYISQKTCCLLLKIENSANLLTYRSFDIHVRSSSPIKRTHICDTCVGVFLFTKLNE